MKAFSFRTLFIKTLALFTVIRGYNIAMLVLAQYMATLFVFNDGKDHLQILFDRKINFIIIASALSAAAGYIINNFYDLEKDRIQMLLHNYIDRFIFQIFIIKNYLFMIFIVICINISKDLFLRILN